MTSKLKPVLLRTGLGFFLFMTGVSVINVLFFPFARALYGYPFMALLCAAAAALVLFLLAGHALSRIPEKRLERFSRYAVPTLLAAAFVVQLIMGFLLEYEPLGDNLMLYYGGQMLARDGSFAANPDYGLYLARFSNQWGFLLILTGIFRLLFFFGISNPFFPLVCLQAVLYFLALFLLLHDTGKRFGVRTQLMLLLMLACTFPLYISAAVLYTDTFSLPFVIFALSCALRVHDASSLRGKLFWALLCGLSAFLGGQIKMTVAIALIAAFLWWLFSLRIGHALLCGFVAFSILIGGTAAVQEFTLDHVLDRAVYEQENTPVIHWFMMSIPTSENPYGGYYGDYGETWGMMDEGATHEEVMASIYRRIRDRIYTLRYPDRFASAALHKDSAIMGDGTFGMTEMLDDRPVRRNAVSEIVLSDGAFHPVYLLLTTGIWLAQLCLACLCCVRDIRRRDLRRAVFYISCVGILLFLMLWEVHSRYLYNFVPVFLLLSACGSVPEDKQKGVQA